MDKQETMIVGENLKVITQAPYLEDDANLPNRLHVLGVYTKQKDGSRNVAIIVRNGTAEPIHVVSTRVIASVMAASTVPELEELPELLKKLDAEDPPPKKRLCRRNGRSYCLRLWRRVKDWLPELAWQACHLLLEFHMVFLLEPNKMGCTNAMEHIIKVTNIEPFNKWF